MFLSWCLNRSQEAHPRDIYDLTTTKMYYKPIFGACFLQNESFLWSCVQLRELRQSNIVPTFFCYYFKVVIWSCCAIDIHTRRSLMASSQAYTSHMACEDCSTILPLYLYKEEDSPSNFTTQSMRIVNTYYLSIGCWWTSHIWQNLKKEK